MFKKIKSIFKNISIDRVKNSKDTYEFGACVNFGKSYGFVFINIILSFFQTLQFIIYWKTEDINTAIRCRKRR